MKQRGRCTHRGANYAIRLRNINRETLAGSVQVWPNLLSDLRTKIFLTRTPILVEKYYLHLFSKPESRFEIVIVSS